MSAKRTILNLAKEKDIPTEDIAKIMGFDHVQSFYRAMNTPRTIKLSRIASLSKLLDKPLCEVVTIFNNK